MDSVLTYIKWRGDLTFREKAFNDVDALVFAILAYAEWDDIVFEEEIDLSEACMLFTQSEVRMFDEKRYAYSPEIPVLVKNLQNCKRYKKTKIKKYRSILDPYEETQFSAVTFVLEDDTTIISYRGTDSSILGWKEDFYMTYKETIPAQRHALAYLKEVLSISSNKKRKFNFMKNHKDVYLVGHSKGGNLAMYSAIKAKTLQEQITRVYNFDGPGFLSSFYEKNEMSVILPKIKSYIPAVSIIGRLLEHREEQIVIEGFESGLMQHSAFKWNVQSDGFVLASGLKPESDEYINYIEKVLLSKSKKQKEKLLRVIFASLENLSIEQITDLGELSIKRGIEGIKEWASFSVEEKRFFMECISFLLTQTRDFLFPRK